TPAVLLLASLTSLAWPGAAPQGPTPVASGFVVRTTTVDGATYRYQVFVPRRAGRGGRPPVIPYLPGAGERGTDGDLQTMGGPGPVVKGPAEPVPAVVVPAQ